MSSIGSIDSISWKSFPLCAHFTLECLVFGFGFGFGSIFYFGIFDPFRAFREPKKGSRG
jgi:hypothetical protein